MDRDELKREVQRAARGDGDSAAFLFDHYYPRVYRYCLAKLGNRMDAEDAAAETFAKVLRQLGQFRWRGAGFEAWLFRIASNVVVDLFRRAQREQLQDDLRDHGPVDEITPEVVFLRGEATRGVDVILDRLSPDQREVIVLRFAAGLDTAEVAQIMGRKANAVRQLQFRALEHLRTTMPKEQES